MATKKAEGTPRFPNPPLEVGVAQYPTPLVPDYYTKDGHIILIEKVSIEKGSYNPQPLDGSITYSARDANKWPSTLYLVFQRPEETGQFVYNYWANDRTLASQDPWNYGVSYSTENPAFPIYTRVYITPRSQYAPVALGSVDPVFGGTAIIAKQQMLELGDDNPLRSRYVQVQRVYESIPSAVLTGKKLDERGDIETITTQVVVAGTAPASDGLLVTKTTVEPVDSVKSTQTYGSVESYATLTTKVKKSGLLGEASVTDDIVSPTTNPDALSTTIIDSSVEAISATKSRKRTTTSTGPSSLSGNSKKSGLLGNAATTESIVASGTSADALSLTILQSEVTPIDSAKSKKTTVESSGPTTLEAQKISERGDTQTITKSIVAVGTVVTTDNLLLVSSQVDEIDEAKSQKTDVTVASYSTLTTKANKSGLLANVETTDDIVDPTTNPDELSTTVLESSVEAISATKSRKRTTTATGPTELDSNEKKSGLLGETTISQSIVAYGSAPDNLSTTIVTSSVEAIDAFKSKKTTVTSTGPSSLTSPSKKAGLLGEVSVVESIVAFDASPDALSTTVISSEVTAIDSAKSKKTTATATGPTTLSGVSNKGGLFGEVTTTESIVAYGSAADSLSTTIIQSEVTPIDAYKSKRTTIEATGPTTLSGGSQKGGLLGITSTTESIVAYGSAADSLSTTIIQSEVTPIDAYKSKKSTTTASGPTTLGGNAIGEFGLITTVESIVAYGLSLPTPTKNTVKLDQTPVDLAKAKLTNARYDDLSTLTGYQYDADLNLIVTNTKEIVAAGAEAPSITNGLLSSRDEIIDKWKTVRIQSKIISLPAGRTEYKTGAYASPNLVYGFSTSVTQLPNWDLNVTVTPVMRAKRSYQTVFKHVTSYVYGTPDPTPAEYTIYDPVSINLYYDGYFLKIKIEDALTDSVGILTFTTASNDPVHGSINETYEVPTTTESATTYLGKVGTYQLIAYEIDYWKANIWRVSEQWVLLK